MMAAVCLCVGGIGRGSNRQADCLENDVCPPHPPVSQGDGAGMSKQPEKFSWNSTLSLNG